MRIYTSEIFVRFIGSLELSLSIHFCPCDRSLFSSFLSFSVFIFFSILVPFFSQSHLELNEYRLFVPKNSIVVCLFLLDIYIHNFDSFI